MERNSFSVKRSFSILFLCFIFGSIMAQRINLDTLNIDQLNVYKDKAIRMSNAGKIMVFTGVPVAIVSFALASAAFQTDRPWLKTDFAGYVILGALFAGSISTLVGIPLWVTGGSRKAKVELAIQKFKVVPQNSMALGLGIKLRF